MKKLKISIFIFITGLLPLLIISAGSNFADEADSSSKEELIKTDREFSEKSVKEGISSAFIAYADEDVILMRDKQFPILGIKELKEYYSKIKKGNAKLEWSPVKAEISKSGELGYTFGNWIYSTKDSKDTVFGNYVTIWKKQKDGSWKFVLDGGNTTPPPASKK
jgi:ketosteroid isomerase-like protein